MFIIGKFSPKIFFKLFFEAIRQVRIACARSSEFMNSRIGLPLPSNFIFVSLFFSLKLFDFYQLHYKLNFDYSAVPVTINPASLEPVGASSDIVIFMSMSKVSLESANNKLGHMFLFDVLTDSKSAPHVPLAPPPKQSADVLGEIAVLAPDVLTQLPASFTVTFHRNRGLEPPINCAAVTLDLSSTLKFEFPSSLSAG